MSANKYTDVEILEASKEMQKIKDFYLNEGKRSFVRQFPSEREFEDICVRVLRENNIEVKSAWFKPLYEKLYKRVMDNIK